MISDQLIRDVIAGWQRAPGNENPPPPDEESLRLLLDLAYRVSHRREEGHPILTKLVSIAPPVTDPEYVVFNKRRLMRFDCEKLLTPEVLAKLARAFDPLTTAIGVYPTSVPGEALRAWGVMFSSSRGKSRLADFAESEIPPRALTIIAQAPGSLLIGHGDRLFGRIIGGEFILSMPTPFLSRALGRHVINEVLSHPGHARFGNAYWLYYRDFLELLLTKCSVRSQGGTIVWIPERSLKSAEPLMIPKSLARDCEGILTTISELCELDLHGFDRPEVFRLRKKRQCVEHAEFLAQLTCIDGALIVTDEFRPISFGTILQTKSWDGEIVTGPNGYDDTTHSIDLSRHGTRHQSAVSFSGQCSDAIVFIVSKDGPIRAVKKVGDHLIHWWPDCLSSVFL